MDAMLADHRWLGVHGIGRFAGEILSRLPELHPVPALWHPLHPLEPARLSWVLCRLRPKVYFSPGFNPPLWSPVPFVFTLHDLIHIHFPAEASLPRQAYYRLVVRPAIQRAYRVLTVSRYTKQEILAWAGVPDDTSSSLGSVGPAFAWRRRHAPGYPYISTLVIMLHKNLVRLLGALPALA
jgi:hypothetical protein